MKENKNKQRIIDILCGVLTLVLAAVPIVWLLTRASVSDKEKETAERTTQETIQVLSEESSSDILFPEDSSADAENGSEDTLDNPEPEETGEESSETGSLTEREEGPDETRKEPETTKESSEIRPETTEVETMPAVAPEKVTEMTRAKKKEPETTAVSALPNPFEGPETNEKITEREAEDYVREGQPSPGEGVSF